MGRVVCTNISPMLPVWCSVWGGWSVLKYYPSYLYGVQCGEGGLYLNITHITCMVFSVGTGEGGLCTKILPILPVWCSV